MRIVDLSQRPDLADTCAAWSFGEWGSQNEGDTLKGTLQRYRARSKDQGTTPLWIALNDTGKPMAMAGLRNHDHPDRTDLTPWLTSIYVHPYYRRQNVASRMISFAERQAASLLNFKTLYLYSSDDGENLYRKLGWQEIGRVRDLSGLNSNGKSLMKKDLAHV